MNAVLLLAFGGPTHPEEIRPFIANVIRGRHVPPERAEEVARHYEIVGGCSPLTEVTFRQAEALRQHLAREGPALPVYVGMRNWKPYVVDTLREMTARGVRRATAIVLAPHRSEASWEPYIAAVDSGRTKIGPTAPAIDYAGLWHAHPLFIEAVASRVDARCAAVRDSWPGPLHVLFTAHSIPVPMSNASGPDVRDTLRALAADGIASVIVAPIGFVCEQVELTYDLDVETRALASELALNFARARAVDDHPAFIRLLAELVCGAGLGDVC
jgi:ferrochelatase